LLGISDPDFCFGDETVDRFVVVGIVRNGSVSGDFLPDMFSVGHAFMAGIFI